MDVKPGWQTTEFWITMITNVVGIVNLFKPVQIGQSAIAQAAAIVVIIVTNVAYIWSRTHTKAVASQTAAATAPAK